ncbi:hypothetical protein D3C73_918800 [compost metagenome]
MRRVIARRNGFLNLLDVGQLGLGRRSRVSGVDMWHAVGQQLRVHLQAAATPKREFLAVLQMHGHGAIGSGHQLIAGKQPIPLDQRTASAVAGLGEHLANDLTDDTDERSHMHFLRCQQLLASCCLRRRLMAWACHRRTICRAAA